MADNLRFYAPNAEPPKEACKGFTREGGYSGTDINGMWRIKALTETFGPVGFGWRTTATFHTETYSETDVRIYCDLLLYVKDPETREWSAPIEGYGGNSVVSVRKGKPYVNDECYKMAETDALGSACKKIGIGAKVYWDKDLSKYTIDEDGNVEVTTKTDAEVKAERRQANAEKAWIDTMSGWMLTDPMVAGIIGNYCTLHGQMDTWNSDTLKACYDECLKAREGGQ